MKTDKLCLRCGVGVVKRWSELTDDEREVVKRLPGAAEYSIKERESMHTWCIRCWHEETDSARDA